jgi:dynein heavy chain 2, cytosolic
MTAQVPRVNSEAKAKIAMVEDLTRTWIKLLEEYRDVNWRTKAFPYAERTSTYIDKIEDVRSVLVLFDEIRFIKERIAVDIDLAEVEDLFASTVPLSTNPVLARSWNKAKRVFLNVLESKAFALSTYFKENVLSTSKASKRPLKLLQEMHRWNALLNLDSIKNTLQEEKKQIFKIVSSHVDRIKH